jgi:hypothetical protein
MYAKALNIGKNLHQGKNLKIAESPIKRKERTKVRLYDNPEGRKYVKLQKSIYRPEQTFRRPTAVYNNPGQYDSAMDYIEGKKQATSDVREIKLRTA